MKYTSIDIRNSLLNVGLSEGDDVFIHSNIGFFGICEGITSSQELAKCFFDTIFNIVGSEGTIIVPTFTYSGCKGEDYDPNITPHKMGILSNYVMNLADSIRSLDCNFSISAIGKRALFYTDNVTPNSFAENSFFDRMLKKNCKILCLNFDSGSTFVHYVERSCKVAYRYDKKFISRVKIGDQWKTTESFHFVYSLDRPQDKSDCACLHELSLKNEIAKLDKLSNGFVLLENSRDLFNFIEVTLKERPRFLLKEEY